jgi:hypothetical protein
MKSKLIKKKSKLKLDKKKSKLKLNKKKSKTRNMRGGTIKDGDGKITYVNENLIRGEKMLEYTQEGQIGNKLTYFYFERLTSENLGIWQEFVKQQKKVGAEIANDRNINTTGKKKIIHFTDGYSSLRITLDLYNPKINYIWIAYSSTLNQPINNKFRITDIEMAVSVFFQPGIPITSHMGITRNYLFFSKEMPSTKNLSVYLHSFAASSVLKMCNEKKVENPPKYIMTRPATTMGHIILKKFASLDTNFEENNPVFNPELNQQSYPKSNGYYSANKIENVWVCDVKDRTIEYYDGMCIPKNNDDSEKVFPLTFLQKYDETRKDVYTKLNKKYIDDYRQQLKNEMNERKKNRIEKYIQELNSEYTLLPVWEFEYEGKQYKFNIPPWYDINEDKPLRKTVHGHFMNTSLPNIIMDLSKLASFFSVNEAQAEAKSNSSIKSQWECQKCNDTTCTVCKPLSEDAGLNRKQYTYSLCNECQNDECTSCSKYNK